MRLAWFSPVPPVRSGVAACTADLVSALRDEHEIDIYVDEPVAAAAAGARVRQTATHEIPPPAELDLKDVEQPCVRSAHDFVWRHALQPYDLTVYQLGNASYHDYLWPYLFRYPGLAVLHDVHLHHARAASLLRQGRVDDYRQEFAANAPDVNPDAAELAVAGFDSHLLYEWPFNRLVLGASRTTAVHTRGLRDTLLDQHPGAAVVHVRLGHGTALPAASRAERGAAARVRLGISPDAVLFGCFGGLTPHKRVPQILGAFEAVMPYLPSARLLLAGPEADHYDVRADVSARGLDDRVVLTGYLPHEDGLTDCIAACDVALNLRWPTAREVSGPWLRCMAAGKPSIVIDLVHTADVPSLDPRTWLPGSPATAAPIAVAIDLLDEDHSLRLAVRRLGSDAALRDALGAAAQRYWQREHSLTAMIDDYRRVIRQAASAPVPRPVLPAHAAADGTGVMTDVLGAFGVPVPWSKI